MSECLCGRDDHYPLGDPYEHEDGCPVWEDSILDEEGIWSN